VNEERGTDMHDEDELAVTTEAVNDRGGEVVSLFDRDPALDDPDRGSHYDEEGADRPEPDVHYKAHWAAFDTYRVFWDALSQESETGIAIDWAQMGAAGPFCGCEDCVVREILHAAVKVYEAAGVDFDV
jgi:hypothetical protein